MKLHWFVTGIVLSVTLIAYPTHAVKLKYGVKEGDTWERKISFKGNGTVGADMGLDVLVDIATSASATIKSVDQDGAFQCTLGSKMDKLSVTANGIVMQDQPIPAMKPVTLSLTSLGLMSKVEGFDGDIKKLVVDPISLLCMALPQFPDRELKEGDTWDASPNPELVPIKITGKLVSLKKVDDKDAAEVEYTFTIPSEVFTGFIGQVSGMENVEVSGLGASGTLTTIVDIATGIPGACKGSCTLDLRAKNPAMEVPIAMKTEVAAEVPEQKQE